MQALLCTAVVCASGANPVSAGDSLPKYHALPPSPLKPRVETTFRHGSTRNIGVIEGWAPLFQGPVGNDVLYTDLRFMHDNADNNEGNIGLGYRRIVPEARGVLGTSIWIDKRKSPRGTYSHQITLGTEYLGKDVDLRANGYMPLSGTNRYVTPNIGSTTPYLSGSGIYVDGSGLIVEEAQRGFDVEAGIPVRFKQQPFDSLRLYGGVYNFYGRNTPDVHGKRFRAEMRINSSISIGTRIQTDNIRDRQAFLEATLRFPFSAKKLERENDLYARLDESPERDIDIVTGETVDTGRLIPAINADTGTAQRVLYVDNTAAAGGNGTKESPFNTLLAAQTALEDHDILYIAHGDGTTTGQNQGITISANDVNLIGSGVAFTWDSSRYSARNGASISSGTVLQAATAAPVITNTQVHTVDSTGNGIYIMGANAEISGVTIDGATNIGIYSNATNNENLGSLHIHDVTSKNNAGQGINLGAESGGDYDSIIIEDSDIFSNLNHGIRIGESSTSDATGSVIADARISNVNAHDNAGLGVSIRAYSNGSITTALIENITAENNTSTGALIDTTAGGTIGTATIRNSTTNTNTAGGVKINASGAGSTITTATISNNTTNTNASPGQYIGSSSGGAITTAIITGGISNGNTGGNGQGIQVISTGAGSTLGTVNLTNNTTNSNVQQGQYISSQTSGLISNLNITGATASTNTNRGIYVLATTSGTITSANISGTTADGNTGANGRGIHVEASGATIGTATLNSNTTNNNSFFGIYVTASSAGTISTTSVSNSTASSNGDRGIYLHSKSNGDITTATISNNTASNNTGGNGYGIEIQSSGAGSTITTATISGNITNNNAVAGLYIRGDTSGILTGSTVSTHTSTGNTSNGVFIDDDTTSAYYVDMGGGTLGGTGNNRIYSNTGTEIRVDLDGGQLKAENNWWGVGTGLAGGETTLDAASTIDANPFLAADPNP